MLDDLFGTALPAWEAMHDAALARKQAQLAFDLEADPTRKAAALLVLHEAEKAEDVARHEFGRKNSDVAAERTKRANRRTAKRS